MQELPEHVMSEVLWSFIGKPYPSLEDFNRELRDYQIEIGGEDTWVPDKVAIPRGKIEVQYMCWREGDQVEPSFLLESDNGIFFTRGELLYKVHNAVVADLREIDHHFFEGFRLYTKSRNEEVPLYFLTCGS